MTAPTNDPANDKVRQFAMELAAATASEMVLTRIARRLKNGRSRPSRRYVRRFAGAVLSELIAEGMADLYWERRRLRAEVDRRIIEARVNQRHVTLPNIPSQRSALANELEPAADRLGVR